MEPRGKPKAVYFFEEDQPGTYCRKVSDTGALLEQSSMNWLHKALYLHYFQENFGMNLLTHKKIILVISALHSDPWWHKAGFYATWVLIPEHVAFCLSWTFSTYKSDETLTHISWHLTTGYFLFPSVSNMVTHIFIYMKIFHINYVWILCYN